MRSRSEWEYGMRGYGGTTYDPAVRHCVLPERTCVDIKVPQKMIKVMYRMVRLYIDITYLAQWNVKRRRFQTKKIRTERAIDPFFRFCSAKLFEPDPIDVGADVVDDVRC
jgi:hypothetical protein